MKGKKLALLGRLLLGGLLMLAVWMLLVWVSSRPALKALIDLTPHRVNSVDPVSEELLRDLRAQRAAIEFHLFAPPWQGQGQNDFARQSLAIRHSLVEQTKLLLRRYAYLGAESVKLVEYDFSRDAAAARDAAMAFDYKVQEGETVVVAITMPGKERRFRKLSLVTDLAVIDLPNTGGAPQQSRSALPVLRCRPLLAGLGAAAAAAAPAAVAAPAFLLLGSAAPPVLRLGTGDSSVCLLLRSCPTSSQ